MLQDRFGLPISIQSASARDAYVQAVDLMLSANAGAEPLLRQAIDEEPGFALAHAALARLCQMNARGGEAMTAASAARELAAEASGRERGHVEAVALLIEGKPAESHGAVLAHLGEFPHDAVPLSLALGVYGLIGFSGRRGHHREQRELLEDLAGRWGEDWWFLTYLGWSRVEDGEPALGVPAIERGLELNPRNAHGAHARAHAYYEMGEPQSGIAFIDGWLPAYEPAAQLHCHLSWHRALFALQTGDAEAALALYEAAIAPSVAQSPPLFTLADAASLLWRLDLYGHPIGQVDWQPVAELARSAFPHAGIGFADVHAGLALAGTGDAASGSQRIEESQALADAERLPAGPVIAQLCRGIAALGAGDNERAAEALRTAMDDLPRIGGSHAQRDVIVDSLIVAELRAGNRTAAEAVLLDRTKSRAPHLNQDWLSRITVAAQ